MSSVLAGDDLAMFSASNSRRSAALGSSHFQEVWQGQSDGFSLQSTTRQDDEAELMLAAIERLPTYDRMRKGVLRQILDNGMVVCKEVDVTKLGMQDKKLLMKSILEVEEDNEKMLRKLRDRVDRVGIEIPRIEIRFENLCIEGKVHVGSRALPTLFNATMNSLERVLGLIRLAPSKKRKIQILNNVSGIVRPSRMTLLLGPRSAGKTTLLLALAGKLDSNLKVTGKTTFCGHEFNEFVPQSTCAYISQHDLHYREMTVRETFDFSGCCLGVGTRYEMGAELSRREREAGIKPDPSIDAFMKATAMAGQETSLVTDYVLKILGLDICADIVMGDDMRRGISGGQKKRVTIGEMLVGPSRVLLMDEISTGLDCSTTFQIVNFLRQMVHIMDVTMIISLLQPTPEVFELFDHIILLAEGQIVYQGPRENVLEYFEYMGFKCPKRKGVTDFLQEVTSKKDQEQYWFRKNQRYKFVSVPDFVCGFSSFHIGQQLELDLTIPYDKSRTHPAALVMDKFRVSRLQLFKACFRREWLLMKRNSFIFVFRTTQIAVMSLITGTVFLRTEMPTGRVQDGGKFFGALLFSLISVMFNGFAEQSMTVSKLPVFYKQRDFLFYPAWAYAVPIWVLRIPLSIIESGIWVIVTYYTIGFAPAASRFFKQFLACIGIHQMALSLFRFIGAVGRTEVLGDALATFVLIILFVLGGVIIAKDDIEPCMIWAYYISPVMYGQTATVLNEFLDRRWSTPNLDPGINEPTVGKVLLKLRGFYVDEYWFWICIGALFGFSLLFNILFICALSWLNPLGDSRIVVVDEDLNNKKKELNQTEEGIDMQVRNSSKVDHASVGGPKRGMVLPFQPLSLAFNHVNYYVDMPVEMKRQGVKEARLQLLQDVSGSFRPGILTALVGVSGAGKTTLMDVLAGRKTSGYIEGNISISGYPKNQATFVRISGYCEQNDIHSPYVTVYESLLYSAWLRLSSDIDTPTCKMFVEEIMDLVELDPLRDAIVGLPGVDGLSTEQRKRLTIAVELVANPSIIFMDEPTTGLDARAAAIVMRAVRNTVDTGRAVVCTIHQPSIDIFEAFDELLLMKRGGQVIYTGQIGEHSNKLIEYFEGISGVPKIKEGCNPATWMLEISASTVEAQLNVDFADLFANSALYRRNQELIKELSTPAPRSRDLHFCSTYSQPYITQCKACFWKQYWSYWRNPQYNGIRFLMTFVCGILFGLIFWNKGGKTDKQQDLMNSLGAMYCAVVFLGISNAISVLPVVATERAVSYRERAAGMYSALSYAFAQVAVEAIYVANQAMVYTILLYSMMGFEWKAGKFLWFYYYITMCFLYFTLYGMMVVALTPSLIVGCTIVSFFLMLWNLFSGYIIPVNQIPVWWRWYYWATPVSWTLYGVITSQFGDKNAQVEVPGVGNMSLKAFLKDVFGFEYDFLPIVAIVHIAWVAFFLFLFAFGYKFLNFQKR